MRADGLRPSTPKRSCVPFVTRERFVAEMPVTCLRRRCMIRLYRTNRPSDNRRAQIKISVLQKEFEFTYEEFLMDVASVT